MKAYYSSAEHTTVVLDLADNETFAGYAGPQTVLVPPVEGNYLYDQLVKQNVTITDNVPPPPPITTIPMAISARQFYQAMAQRGDITNAEALDVVKTGQLPVNIRQFLQKQTSQDAFNYEMMLVAAAALRRDHPTMIALFSEFGWDEAKIEDIWSLGATL